MSKNGVLIDLLETKERYSHASTLTVFIQEILEKENLTLSSVAAIALSKGPGSYTGLRIGTSVAKGICYALDKPLIAVDTLRALAQATCTTEKIEGVYVPMIDARRMEVYMGIFDKDNNILEPIAAKIIDETSFLNWLEKGRVIFSGDGASKCQAVITHPNAVFSDAPISSANLVSLAYDTYLDKAFEDVAYFSPFYLKSPNITKSKKKLL